MQILVKLSDVIDFYHNSLKIRLKSELNVMPIILSKNDEGKEYLLQTQDLMAFNDAYVRFADFNEKLPFLKRKIDDIK